MDEDDSRSPEDEFREMLRQFLEGGGEFDADSLAQAAGLPSDPSMLAALMAQFQNALNRPGDGIDWSVATQQAEARAAQENRPVGAERAADYDQALQVAQLWLSEATDIAELTSSPRLLERPEWVRLTMPVWSELAEPVALSIADALTGLMREQMPEELSSMLPDPGRMMRTVGGVLFAMQLGQVVGQLSTEVVSGGDIGIALGDGEQAMLLPQNAEDFSKDLDVDAEQVRLYLAVRELAHARLFRHAKWLRLHLLSQITDFARGIQIDHEHIEQIAEHIDPENTEELREILISGRLIPPKSEQQLAAHARIETMLALVEGWVDVVTRSATVRLPKADAVAEMVRRRRAVGGPAESAFATLIGLELRPRRLREAAAMWQRIHDELGADARDQLWAHPDLLPTADDIDTPEALIARIAGGADAEPDAMDQALEALLDEEDGERD